MIASNDPHGSILNSLDNLAVAHDDVREPYCGSAGEFRPYERFVNHYDHFFLLAPVGAGQNLKDFEAFRGLFFKEFDVLVES